jgi:hypothetical protein
VVRIAEKRNVYRLLVGKPQEKRPLGNGRVDIIKMDLGGIGWGGMDWIGLAHDMETWRALVNAVTNIRVP